MDIKVYMIIKEKKMGMYLAKNENEYNKSQIDK